MQATKYIVVFILFIFSTSALAVQSNFTVTIQTTGNGITTITSHDGNIITALGHTWSLSGPNNTDWFTGADLVLDGKATSWHGTTLSWNGATLTLAYHGPYDFATQDHVPPPLPPPGTSPDGSILMAGSSGNLVTSAGAWTFPNNIYLNGQQVGGSSTLELEVANNGNMYAYNGGVAWYEWVNSAWISVADPATVPPPVTITTVYAGDRIAPTPYSMTITAADVTGSQPFGKFM